MERESENLAGAAWLAQRFGVECVMPVAVASRIGGRRSTRFDDGIATETYVESMRPAPTLRAHLVFHLKHEVPHLELLARVFDRCDPRELADWIEAEPTGRYARRACFLYEFLTGSSVPSSAEVGGAYVDVVDDSRVVAATNGLSVPNRRWRVRDNLPGSREFCPVVRKTNATLRAMTLDVAELVRALEVEFGDELLMRSAVWMTLRESRASFEIEGEADKPDRIQRFADVLARRTGRGPSPLEPVSLAELQAEILGPRTAPRASGLRRSPVFVGEFVRRQEVVHYVAPPHEDVAAMLRGLQIFLERTRGQSAVMRAAVASFGFVYIHPLADGNGRVHRFLVNDVLRRDGVLHEPTILPVSALISSDAAERRAYARILDAISAPLVSSLAGRYEFTATTTIHPDGVASNFVCRGDDLARPAWRYPDLGAHVEYLSGVLERTLREDMPGESRYLRSHALARAAIKEVIEMPDAQVDRVIRSVLAHPGELSGALAREVPALLDDATWSAVARAVLDAFADVP